MKLKRTASYPKTYSEMYQGKEYHENSFACLLIDDEQFLIDKTAPDYFSKYESHLKNNIWPIIENGLDNQTIIPKERQARHFVIHRIDGLQGDVQPSLLIRRDDFAALSDNDKKLLDKIVDETVKRYNQSKPTPNMFSSKYNHNEKTHHYHLRTLKP